MIFTELNKAYVFYLIATSYLTCFLLCIIALFMTYFIGPGYPSDHFKFVKLDPVEINAPNSTSENQEELG